MPPFVKIISRRQGGALIRKGTAQARAVERSRPLTANK